MLMLDKLIKNLRRKKIITSDLFEILMNGNRNAKNILILSEYLNATYFISFDIPLRAIYEKGNINFAVASEKFITNSPHNIYEKWFNMFRPDLVIMSRNGDINSINILNFFRGRGVPVIYHIDDDLLDLPNELGAEIISRNGSPERMNSRHFLLKNSDLIYASTSYLGNLLQTRFPQKKIFSGIYAPYLSDFLMDIEKKPRKISVIGYMGSKGHQYDLALVVPAIERIMDTRADVEFEIFGTIKMPTELERFGQRVRSYSVKKSYSDFLKELKGLNWKVGLAPLIESNFNYCKAPTKIIEYASCDIMPLASDINVYSKPFSEKLLFFADQNNWYEKINFILDNEEETKKTLNRLKNYCSSKFSLVNLENQLINIFKFL